MDAKPLRRMFSLYRLVKFSLVAMASAISTHIPAGSNGTGIHWGPCDKTELVAWGVSTAMHCANLSVPLDYSNKSCTDRLTLQLARVPATVQPSRGTIQINFGGPGSPGRPALASTATILRNMTGGVYDLVAFDPRGTGNTISFNCASTDLDALTFLQNFGNPNASDTAFGRSWAAAQIDAQKCATYNNVSRTGGLINTAFTARDLMSVVDALGEDGMLRYYGLSYGTVIGATVAAMFPDRIDKVVLDGVENPHEYYHASAAFQEWTQADKALSAMFSFCVDTGPEACPLVVLNMTANELESAYLRFVASVREQPLVVAGSIFGYTEIKNYVSTLLYNNSRWTNFTATLATIFTRPENAAQALERLLDPSNFGGSQNESATLVSSVAPAYALFGILCGDRTARANNPNDFVPVFQELTNISAALGDVSAQREMVCAQWLIEPKERYNGDFKAQTANPILIVTNDGDAITPVISAYNVSSGFPGSVVLELTDAYGHTSINVPSSCALKHISQYWQHGTLPPKGTKCEVEAKPYAGVTWDDVIANATDENTTLASRTIFGEEHSE